MMLSLSLGVTTPPVLNPTEGWPLTVIAATTVIASRTRVRQR